MAKITCDDGKNPCDTDQWDKWFTCMAEKGISAMASGIMPGVGGYIAGEVLGQIYVNRHSDLLPFR